MLEAVFASLIAAAIIATIIGAWRLEFGPNGKTPFRTINLFTIGLCIAMLIFEGFVWRYTETLAVLALIATSPALAIWSRYRATAKY